MLFEEIEMILRNARLPPRVSFVPLLQYMSSLNLPEADAFRDTILNGLYPSQFPQYGAQSDKKRWTHITQAQSECKLCWIDAFVEIEDSKFPFAMVSYKEDLAPLPWIELEDDFSIWESRASSPKTITEGLSHHPSCLEISNSDSSQLSDSQLIMQCTMCNYWTWCSPDISRHYSSGTSQISGNPMSIDHVLGAILGATDQNEDVQQKFWQEENKICINRFPDLKPLRHSRTRSIT